MRRHVPATVFMMVSKNTQVTSVLLLIAAMMIVALLVRGGQVITALAVSTTNSTYYTANITNVEPVCWNITCYDADGTSDNIDLIGGDQRNVYCDANCRDDNAWSTVANVTGQITTGGPDDCSPSNTNCYVNSTCWNTTVGNVTGAYVRCGYKFWFHADNTSRYGTWQGRITVGDNAGLYSMPIYDGINVSELLAMGTNATLAFGPKAAAVNDSTVLHTLTLFNYGNTQMDFKVNGSNPGLTCTGGVNIAAEYIRGNLTNGGIYQASYGLTTTLAGPNVGGNRFDPNLTENTTATNQTPGAPVLTTYWGIGVPSAVSGNCQGIMWFAATLS